MPATVEIPDDAIEARRRAEALYAKALADSQSAVRENFNIKEIRRQNNIARAIDMRRRSA
jgi:hypothetical protein